MTVDFEAAGGSRPLRRGLLERSGQQWKITVGVVVLPSVGMALVGLTVLFSQKAATDATLAVKLFAVALGSLSLACASYAWATLTVRCTTCGARWLWMAVRDRGPMDWLPWLRRLARCPVCAAED